MTTIETKRYEDSVKSVLKTWRSKVEQPLADIQKINEQLDKLDAGGDVPPEKKGELRAKALATRKAKQDLVDAAQFELEKDLSYLKDPPQAPKSELEKTVDKLKGFFDEVQKGLPLAKEMRLKPDVEFDFKKLKFKKLGLTFKWNF